MFKNLFIITTILLWCVLLTGFSFAGDYYPMPLVMMPCETSDGARIENCTIKLFKKDPNECYVSNLHYSSHILPTDMIVELQIFTVEKNIDNNISIEISDKKSKFISKGNITTCQPNSQKLFEKIYSFQFNSNQFRDETTIELFYKNSSIKLTFQQSDIYYSLIDGKELYSKNGNKIITCNKNYLTIVERENMPPYDFVLYKDGKVLKYCIGLEQYVETSRNIPFPMLEPDDKVQECK